MTQYQKDQLKKAMREEARKITRAVTLEITIPYELWDDFKLIGRASETMIGPHDVLHDALRAHANRNSGKHKEYPQVAEQLEKAYQLLMQREELSATLEKLRNNQAETIVQNVYVQAIRSLTLEIDHMSPKEKVPHEMKIIQIQPM